MMITHEASTDLRKRLENPDEAWKVDAVSHLVRQMSDRNPGRAVFIKTEDTERWLNDRSLAIETPSSQAQNLIVWMGMQVQNSQNPASFVGVDSPALASIIGSRNERSSVDYITKQMSEDKLVEYNMNQRNTNYSMRLTFKGWERFDELQKNPSASRQAFMAMQFNDARLERVFAECFKPAIADAGFELRRLTDGQAAGLIDDQLRVGIRTSKFLVADLSHGNRGAYWEAGFAEGLGRPVIYVCDEDIWKHECESERPHFDTNHLNTVIWKEGNLITARAQLANMIRNTFPADAKFD